MSFRGTGPSGYKRLQKVGIWTEGMMHAGVPSFFCLGGQRMVLFKLSGYSSPTITPKEGAKLLNKARSGFLGPI